MNPTASSFAPTSTNGPATTIPSAFDARLRTMVRKALASSGYPPVSALDCQVRDGVVVLRGTVGSFYLKQVAQESVRRLGMADRIENCVTVEY